MQIFDKIKAECVKCGTPLNGEDIDEISGSYYCRSDYEKEMERPENEVMKRENDEIKNILTDEFEYNLAHDYDFTLDWTATNATASSAKVWVGSTTGGKISKVFSQIVFGNRYAIKVIASATAGSVTCYNSNDDTKQLGADSFEDTFIALTKYIEFRNSSVATNTISFIEIREL